MRLAIPLTADQIRIAGRLSGMLEQGMVNDHALVALAERFPGFDADAALLKVVTLNALYGTRIYPVNRMAQHVQAVLSGDEVASAGCELVERLARLPPSRPDEKLRSYVSFASKFAHFFIDAQRFPILDSYAEWMVGLHLGKPNLVRDPHSRYAAFVQNLARLRALVGWNGTNRELDDYLWFAGQYWEWRRNPKGQINAEAQRFFENPPPGVAAELDALLPAILDKVFKGEL
jgi:hypothetical protein